ncbi:hypothetical protein D8M04_05985 [Oceanobacillus piezotolerans]|uniref:YCII-related domain-containing protein n=1 Tax=Oceanobacillus piezotolerans TaxID=2448030 RepID=A0A498DFN3_9BACI|nr:YciI family protein [Oceanobacillus piezotolerans]RLL46751.1 hypothetical protein D8M04_05985 [Oceanobacillus piezotolerans]
MRYFAVFLPMKDEEKSKAYRPEHLAYLEQKEEERKVFARGPFIDGTGGFVVYIADNLEEAERMVKEDPYIVHGARNYEIREWAMTTKANLPE